MIASAGRRILVALLLISGGMTASADDKNDEYRLTVFPTYALTEDQRWVGIGYFGYAESPDDGYQIDSLGLGALRRIEEWAEVWFVALNVRTDNETVADVNEYRPAVRFKNYFTRSGPFTFYNYARMEYRILQRDGVDNDSEYFRFRDRLGIDFALSANANKPGGWYGLADAEVFYRFDRDLADLMCLRAGVGVTINEYVRVEFIYHMQFTRADSGESFEWTENIYRINVKVARHKGLLARLAHGDADE